MTPLHPRRRTGKPFRCQHCYGPCRIWRGSIWQWTCAACIADAVLNGRTEIRPSKR